MLVVNNPMQRDEHTKGQYTNAMHMHVHAFHTHTHTHSKHTWYTHACMCGLYIAHVCLMWLIWLVCCVWFGCTCTSTQHIQQEHATCTCTHTHVASEVDCLIAWWIYASVDCLIVWMLQDLEDSLLCSCANTITQHTIYGSMCSWLSVCVCHHCVWRRWQVCQPLTHAIVYVLPISSFVAKFASHCSESLLFAQGWSQNHQEPAKSFLFPRWPLLVLGVVKIARPWK